MIEVFLLENSTRIEKIEDVEMFSIGRFILTLAFEPFKILESINFGCKPNYWNVNTAVFLDEDKVRANRNRDKQLIYGT